MMDTALHRRPAPSLSAVFLLSCLVIMGTAAAIVGSWVSKRIESAVVQNSANAAALYMESFISPLSQELSESDELSAPARQALKEIFANTPLGDRVVSYKIWKSGGLVVHASDPEIIGERFEPTRDLRDAWTGKISAAFEDLDDDESSTEAALGIPLLEVYSPIRELWSGEVIAVAEFYEKADDLQGELADVRRKSWIVVASTFALSTFALFGIVMTGDRIIASQSKLLATQLGESRAMARQNAELRSRVVEASGRAATQTDRFLRRLGSELHDGPAQYLSLAALRLDAALSSGSAKTEETKEIRNSLNCALSEIRALSRGIALPDLEALSLRETVERAIDNHATHIAHRPDLVFEGDPAPPLTYAERLCLYRFLQETLSNAARYAPEAECRVECRSGAGVVRLIVTDDGPGFDPETAMQLRDDGGQGLMGLRDRIESLGGRFSVASGNGRGTTVSLELPLSTTDRP